MAQTLQSAASTLVSTPLLSEADERVRILERSLPRRIDGRELSDSKLPFKALIHRECLIWRMAELSRGAHEGLRNDQLVIAAMLTRGALETSAALWYLRTKLQTTIEAGTPGDIDQHFMRLIIGSRNMPDMPQAVNVMTFIDCANREIETVRTEYERLCEVAHPNWAETAYLYSKPDQPNDAMDFGVDREKRATAFSLVFALGMFELNYTWVGDLIPQFIGIFEKDLPGLDQGRT